MALTPQPLFRAQDVGVSTTLLPVTPRNWRKWSNKTGDLTRAAAANEAHPRYDSMDDWHGGTEGNDIDVADATQAIAGRNGGIDNDYEPRHQEEKADNMVPPVPLLTDIGKDYQALPGMTGREGLIQPANRYPSTSTAETPAKFVSSTYLGPPEDLG